jgi:hypothetical protein
LYSKYLEKVQPASSLSSRIGFSCGSSNGSIGSTGSGSQYLLIKIQVACPGREQGKSIRSTTEGLLGKEVPRNLVIRAWIQARCRETCPPGFWKRGMLQSTLLIRLKPDWEEIFLAIRKLYQKIKDRPDFEEKRDLEISKVVIDDVSFLFLDKKTMGRLRSIFEKMIRTDYTGMKSPGKKYQAKHSWKAAKEYVERLTAIVKNAEELTVEQLAMSLGSDPAFVWSHLFEWAEHFKFKVKGNLIIFKEGDIADLDKQFKEWNDEEKGGTGKI